MSTRSCIYFVEDGKCLCSIYKHHDGYPQFPGTGWDLYNLLKGRKIQNGFQSGDYAYTVSNGVEDLAATTVAYLKNLKPDSRPGEIYMRFTPEDPVEFCQYMTASDIEYLYEVNVENDNVPILTVFDREHVFVGKFNPIFKGTIEEFGEKMDFGELPDCTLASNYEKEIPYNVCSISFAALERLVDEWAEKEIRKPFSKWLEHRVWELKDSAFLHEGSTKGMYELFKKSRNEIDGFAARYRCEGFGDAMTFGEWLKENKILSPIWDYDREEPESSVKP